MVNTKQTVTVTREYKPSGYENPIQFGSYSYEVVEDASQSLVHFLVNYDADAISDAYEYVLFDSEFKELAELHAGDPGFIRQ